jgi:hypothetical protein
MADEPKTTSPQPSSDPAYQPGQTVGGNTPSPLQPRNVSTDIRASVPRDANARSFVGFPQTKFHPVHGKRVVNDPNEAASLPGPAHNWFDTAGEADMHRTDLEAQEVIHNARRVKLARHQAEIDGKDAPVVPGPDNPDEPGIVRLSVQAEESLRSGGVEPH